MNDHDGEKELVLGNKQLLTIFFVATLLCGVFFAMGYVVRGNSDKVSLPGANTDSPPTQTTEGQRPEPLPSPTPAAAPPATSDPGLPAPAPEPKFADNPIASGAQPPEQTALPPLPLQPLQKPAKGSPAPPAASSPDTGIVVSTPESGASYWQVAAPTRPAADALVNGLRARGLPAILAPSSKPELFEVLVGPYRSSLMLADAKKKLIDLGFNGVILHKQP